MPASISAFQRLRTHLATVPDPRVERTKVHQLLDVLTIAICAVICGADSWVEMEEFGNDKRAFFDQFLLLPDGIPSHDTFGRVFARLDPQPFQTCFLAWVQELIAASGGRLQGVVAIDGKTLHGSRDPATTHGPIHMVSAWATANHLVLGQVKVDEKSNEITAIPQLLNLLDLTDCIVTIDAMGCQTAIADTITARGADYVLALKGNQGTLHQDVITMDREGQATHFREIQHQTHQTCETGHGRIETRRYWLVDDPQYLAYFNAEERWAQLRGIGIVEAERRIGETVSRERRYYLCSITSVAELVYAVRSHWEIENKLHWVLDVAFREDANQAHSEHAAHNSAIMRHIALNLLEQEKTAKCSVKTKRLKAGWSEDYLLKVLLGPRSNLDA